MKINMPNKALSHKILYGAALLMLCLAAPGDSLRHPPLGEPGIFCLVYGCSCDFTPSVKRELERGLAIGIGRSKAGAAGRLQMVGNLREEGRGGPLQKKKRIPRSHRWLTLKSPE